MLNKKALASTPSTPPVFVEDVFSTFLTTGASANITVVNGIDLSGKGGLVWQKTRTSAGSNTLFDTVRGVNNYLVSNTTSAQAFSSNILPTFNSDGFVIGTDNNLTTSAEAGVSWTFRKQAKFFDVVTYTGTGSNTTIAHNLGSVPGMIIVKRTDTTANWAVYHRSLANTQYLVLNSVNGAATGATWWNSTTPTSSVFSLGTDSSVNASGGTYVAYLFAHNAGGFGDAGTDNVISCGSFTSNSSGGITTPVDLGFEPQWLLVKNTSGDGWRIQDVMRGWSQTQLQDLSPSNSTAERSLNNNPSYLSPTATGFSTPTPGIFTPSNTFTYVAIRRPMKVPTDATTVFNSIARTGTGAISSISSVGFATDLAIYQSRGGYLGNGAGWGDRLRGKNKQLYSYNTNAEGTATNQLTGFDFMNSVSIDDATAINASGQTYINWMFKRASGFFDEVCYTGTGTTQTVTHNLGVAPELVIVKQRNATGSWYVWAKPVTSPNSNWWRNYGYLNNTSVFADWGDNTGINSDPTSTTITYGGWSDVNGSGNTFVNYLFATCPGVSKVGSYTGNGTTQAIACGFTGGARFVLIKPTSADNAWYVYDTARGMTTLTDPYLRLNSTAAESATLGSVTTTTGGFTVNGAILSAINTNAVSYLFLAIA